VEGTCRGKHVERAHGTGINVARAKVDQQKVEGHMQSYVGTRSNEAIKG
jgi:hypothetical protein